MAPLTPSRLFSSLGYTVSALLPLLLLLLAPSTTASPLTPPAAPMPFLNLAEFEAAAARHALSPFVLELSPSRIAQTDEFHGHVALPEQTARGAHSGADSAKDSAAAAAAAAAGLTLLQPGAFLGASLTFRASRTDLPASVTLKRFHYNAYVGFVLQGGSDAAGAEGAALQLNSDPTDDDIVIEISTRISHKAQNFQLVYGAGLTLQGNENVAGEAVTFYTPFGAAIARLDAAALEGAKAAAGTGDVFLGLLSPQPIGYIVFDESSEDRDVVMLRRLHLCAGSAHLLDDLPSELQALFWIAFNLFIAVMLLVDMRTGKKKVVVLAEALTWSVVWVAMALAFAAVVYALRGRGPAVVWVTAYVLEKVLSVDNLFVFLTIFASFHTPTRLQHKVLTWGILGAIVLRAVFIFTGVMLVERFSWLLAVFGAFLLYTGGKALLDSCGQGHGDGLTFDSDSAQDILPTVAGGELLDTDRLSDSLTLRVIGSIIPLTRTYDPEGRFLVRDGEPLVVAQPGEHGILWRTFHSLKRVLSWPARVAARALGWEHMRATPLLAVLVIVETTDMVFAADSIPAVLSITQDPFIAYTSNIFAVLGLRALYFALAAAMTEFVYLAPALGFILIFIGAKLLLVMVGVHVSVEATLTLVLVVLVLAVALSLLRGRASGHKRR